MTLHAEELSDIVTEEKTIRCEKKPYVIAMLVSAGITYGIFAYHTVKDCLDKLNPPAVSKQQPNVNYSSLMGGCLGK